MECNGSLKSADLDDNMGISNDRTTAQACGTPTPSQLFAIFRFCLVLRLATVVRLRKDWRFGMLVMLLRVGWLLWRHCMCERDTVEGS
jgi:hypothetical protein